MVHSPPGTWNSPRRAHTARPHIRSYRAATHPCSCKDLPCSQRWPALGRPPLPARRNRSRRPHRCRPDNRTARTQWLPTPLWRRRAPAPRSQRAPCERPWADLLRWGRSRSTSGTRSAPLQGNAAAGIGQPRYPAALVPPSRRRLLGLRCHAVAKRVVYDGSTNVYGGAAERAATAPLAPFEFPGSRSSSRESARRARARRARRRGAGQRAGSSWAHVLSGVRAVLRTHRPLPSTASVITRARRNRSRKWFMNASSSRRRHAAD